VGFSHHERSEWSCKPELSRRQAGDLALHGVRFRMDRPWDRHGPAPCGDSRRIKCAADSAVGLSSSCVHIPSQNARWGADLSADQRSVAEAFASKHLAGRPERNCIPAHVRRRASESLCHFAPLIGTVARPTDTRTDTIALDGAVLSPARFLRVAYRAYVVEAMASHRPYRPGLGIERALAEIEHGHGTVYDPNAAGVVCVCFERSATSCRRDA